MQRLNLTRQDLLGQSLIDSKVVFAWERFVLLAERCESSLSSLKQRHLDTAINDQNASTFVTSLCTWSEMLGFVFPVLATFAAFVTIQDPLQFGEDE